MFQFSRFPFRYKMNTIIFILTSITCIRGDIRIMKVTEGEEINLNFSYPCHSSEVTLRYGYRAPFYDSANPESTPLPENQVVAVHKETERDKCFIRLLFTPVLRSDEGGYILTSYTDGRSFISDTKIGLRVDYPPGKASCKWGEEESVGDWSSAKCTASAGSLRGKIVCYQNGIRAPHFTLPIELDETLRQTIWVRYSQPAFCCAVAIGKPSDRCECKDYKWDPYKNLTDPCSSTTLQNVSSPSKSRVEGDMKANHPLTPAMMPKTKRPNSNVALHVGYSCSLGILALVTIGLSIAFAVAHRKASL